MKKKKKKKKPEDKGGKLHKEGWGSIKFASKERIGEGEKKIK